jgi:hypothetical protein
MLRPQGRSPVKSNSTLNNQNSEDVYQGLDCNCRSGCGGDERRERVVSEGELRHCGVGFSSFSGFDLTSFTSGNCNGLSYAVYVLNHCL